MSFSKLICYSIVFMSYWAGLNSSVDQEAIRRGANTLLNVATATRAASCAIPRIRGPRHLNEVDED
jgi:hypothetical protein